MIEQIRVQLSPRLIEIEDEEVGNEHSHRLAKLVKGLERIQKWQELERAR
jgi:hypothetical protein